MTVIKNFRQIRRDGKIIEESMSLDKIISLGWGVEKVIELQWNAGDENISTFKGKYALLGEVVPNRKAVAVLNFLDEKCLNSSLSILDINGKEKIRIENEIFIQGERREGKFSWFSKPKNVLPSIIGVVFELSSDHSMYLIDIDTDTGGFVGEPQIQK
ncbi:hypothetical protein [Celerinatantimonas sp. YJH-8]|uniref:hypothetical protein n=1 Tax=Celerinatantimonas sp. YJH-8 TaxID=3228714 RepID=UPI0038C07D38